MTVSDIDEEMDGVLGELAVVPRFVRLTEREGPVMLNVDHIVGVREVDGATCVSLSTCSQVAVTESYDTVAGLLEA